MIKKTTGIIALVLACLFLTQLLLVNFTTLPIPSFMFTLPFILLPLLGVLLLVTIVYSCPSYTMTLSDNILLVLTIISMFVEVGYYFIAYPFILIFFHTILRFMWLVTIPLLLIRIDAFQKIMQYIVLAGGVLLFVLSCLQTYISGVLNNQWFLSDHLQNVVDVGALMNTQSLNGVAFRIIGCIVLFVVAASFLIPFSATGSDAPIKVQNNNLR